MGSERNGTRTGMLSSFCILSGLCDIFHLCDFGWDLRVPWNVGRGLCRINGQAYQKEGDLMAGSFAVIRTGGKMYRVSPGQILVVERLEEDGAVIFDQVLMVSEDGVISYATDEKPLAVEVHGRILRQEKDPKIIVFKKKRRKNYRRKKGHRQLVSRVKIESIIKTA